MYLSISKHLASKCGPPIIAHNKSFHDQLLVVDLGRYISLMQLVNPIRLIEAWEREHIHWRPEHEILVPHVSSHVKTLHGNADYPSSISWLIKGGAHLIYGL